MLDWYKQYDQETFMADFSKLEFRKFNPYYRLDGTKDLIYANVAGQPEAKSIFDSSNAFSQMFYQFNLLNREQIKIKPIQDPFSENCMTYARRSCILITSELLQAHLIVS